MPVELVTQYMVHSKRCANIGVVEAMQPTPPAGPGWKLVNVTASDSANTFFHFWKRECPRGTQLSENKFPW